MTMIYFDNIMFSIQRSGGISVVWYELLKRVIRDNDFETRFIEFDNANDNIFRKQLDIKQDRIIKNYKSKSCSWRRYFDIDLPKTNKPFIFHSSYYRVCKNKEAVNITTVHDFTLEYYGKFIEKQLHCWQKYRAIRNSDYIICISENTKKDLLKFLPEIDESKIRVVYNGVSEDYFILDKSEEHKLPYEKESYIIYIGSRYHYKNFDFAIEATKHSDKKFLIVGNELSETETNLLDSKLGRDRYKYLGRVENKELNILYNNAYCLLYPSSYEGFGIPIIEAQKSGCPVIALEGSSVSEVIGDKTLLIDKLDMNDVLEKLEIIKDNKTREDIVRLGLENTKRFSWERMYKEINDIYLQIENEIEND